MAVPAFGVRAGSRAGAGLVIITDPDQVAHLSLWCGSVPDPRSRRGRWHSLTPVRAPVEHGFAHLKNWRVLGKVRTDPTWATALVRALLVLTNREVSR